MSLEIIPSGEACGATVRGVNLTRPLSDSAIADIRVAWLDHHVLSFPDQPMSDDDLERFALSFGSFGDDPFIAPIPGRENIIAVKREATETSPVFAETWHTDWSFQETPPAGTCLFAITIPPVGGDTLFANQHMALEKMPDDLRSRLEGREAIHSARAAYSKAGAYGDADAVARSMDILPSDDAQAEQRHPIVREHPETGRKGIFSCAGYVSPALPTWRWRKVRRFLARFINGKPAKSSSTATNGGKICSSCGIIALFCTWRPAAIRATRDCCIA